MSQCTTSTVVHYNPAYRRGSSLIDHHILHISVGLRQACPNDYTICTYVASYLLDVQYE